MSTTRISGLLLIAFITLWQPAAGDTIEIGRFRALLNNGQRIEGSSGVLGKDSLTGTTKDGNPTSIPVQSIRAIDRSMGTQAGKCALIGGAIGLTSALLGWMQASAEANSDPYKVVDNSKVAPIILGFTAGGAVIGLMIGSSMQNWQKVPIQSSLGYLPEKHEFRLQLSLNI